MPRMRASFDPDDQGPPRSGSTTRNHPRRSRHPLRSSFNLIDTAHGLKVDLFVLGDSLLDRMQIERRVNIAVPHAPNGIWVTAPEDQILRKLDWYRKADGVSDRQWRDVVGILRVNLTSLDQDYLQHTATAVGLADLLTAALNAAAP